MYSNHIRNNFKNDPLLANPIIQESLDWIVNNANHAEEGIFHFDPGAWYVNVHGYYTLKEIDCQWENHTKTIDIQYTIKGQELIRYSPVEHLGKRVSYSEASDTEFFDHPSAVTSSILMSEGTYTIFFPGDAHCPKILVGQDSGIRKLVVKIPTYLIEL